MKTLLLLLLAWLPATATNWYVRPDGGTATQCTGRTDAAYPGSGTGQACAFSNPYYLWTNDTLPVVAATWKIAGGDTVVIKNGTYRMGWKNIMANSLDLSGRWRYSTCGNAQDCSPPPIPAGTAAASTRIVGEEWASGCAVAPKLVAASGLKRIWDLSGTQYVNVECLEMTDNAQCRLPTITGEPYGCAFYSTDHGYRAIDTNLSTQHVLFKHLNIHGFASLGISGPVGGDVTGDHLRIFANGNGGWWFEAAGHPASIGPLVMDSVTIQWSGCVEQYPIVDALPIMGCYDQDGAGANGDALGFIAFDGDYTLTNSNISYNMQDGVDFVHAGDYGHFGHIARVENNKFDSNEGTGLKIGLFQQVLVRNNVLISGCQRMKYGPPFPGMPTETLVPWNQYLASPCRGADALNSIILPGSVNKWQNNTVIAYNSVIFDGSCQYIPVRWDGTARYDMDGTSDPSSKLDGTNRALQLQHPAQYANESDTLFFGTVAKKLGKTYYTGTPYDSNRFPAGSGAFNVDTSRITAAPGYNPSTSVRIRLYSDGALPAPLAQDTYYYPVNISSGTFQLATSIGGSPITLTGTGTGNLYIDKDCTGVKCDAYWAFGSDLLLLDPSVPSPSATSTISLGGSISGNWKNGYHYDTACESATIEIANNAFRAYRRPSDSLVPGMYWGPNMNGTTGLNPADRSHNWYCGMAAGSAYNSPGPTETWASTCPGTWLNHEPTVVAAEDLDSIDPSIPATSPLVDAGATLSDVTMDIRRIDRPQGSAYDVGAYEYTADVCAVTTSSLPAGYVSVPYSQQLTSTRCVAPLTWTLTAGSLCPGLTLSPSGVVSGTPTSAATCEFTAKVLDDNGSEAQSSIPFSMSVTENPVLAVAPSALYFSCITGQTIGALPIFIGSYTGAPIDAWSASGTQSWLSVNPGSGNSAGTATVAVDCIGRSPGTYSDTITVSSSTSGILFSPKTVGVTLVVSPNQTTSGSQASGLGRLAGKTHIR